MLNLSTINIPKKINNALEPRKPAGIQQLLSLPFQLLKIFSIFLMGYHDFKTAVETAELQQIASVSLPA